MNKKVIINIFFYLLVAAIALVVLFPFLWMLASSFKTQVDIISWPPKFIFSPTLQNYQKVFGEQDFLKYFLNSTIVGSLAVGLSLVLGLPAAYSISRYAQKKLAVFILLARLMPGISFLMPWYIIFSRLNLMDSYVALVLSHMLITLPIVVWIMSTYFNSIPREMEESAMVDGATRQYAFWAIILPLSGPGIITATTLSFIFSWNNFMFSQVLSMEKTKTLPIAVYNFVSYAEVDWGGVMAAAVAIMAPAIILTMICQKYVVKGLTMGGGISQPFFKPVAQELSGAIEAGFHGFWSGAQDRRRFGHAAVFPFAEDNGFAQFLGQRPDGLAHGGRALAGQRGLVRGRGICRQRAAQRLPGFRIFRVQRDIRVPRAPAKMVAREVRGNREQPGGKFFAGAVAFGRLEDPHKRLLRQIIRVLFVARHAAKKMKHRGGVAGHQIVQRRVVARLQLHHVRPVERVRISAGDAHDRFRPTWIVPSARDCRASVASFPPDSAGPVPAASPG